MAEFSMRFQDDRRRTLCPAVKSDGLFVSFLFGRVLKYHGMFFSRFGLQSKIIIILSVAVVSVATVSTYLAMLLTRQPVEEAIYRKVLSQALVTAGQIDAHELRNPDRLLAHLRDMQRDLKGVEQCDVRAHDAGHTLLATTDPAGSHLELDATSGIEHYNEFESAGEDQLSIETNDGRDWIVSTPIRDAEGGAIGCLQLRVSKKASNVIINGLVWRNLVLMLASLLAVMLAVHVFFVYKVRRPVRDMVAVMEAAEGGALQVRAHCPDEAKARDEIAQLAWHLNRMLGRMENFNAELAGKVNEATGELARRNEELIRINEELFETQKTLARSERLAVAGQLAASLAHEIGTPLNSISGHVQLMARRKTGDKTMDRRLQVIDSQIENIVRSVKQLLSWTRKFELRPAMIDVRHVIEEVVLLSSPALELRRIKVHTDFPRQAPKIYADAGYLQQVFLNLINNSIDAMPRGGQLHIRVTAVHSEDGHQQASSVKVEVEDTGEGIAPETLKHIFDPMFTTKRMGTGAGLGLAICKQIIQQHGGSIEVRSLLHQGTSFVITLPVDCRVPEETPAPALAHSS
jgi:signal transduction histidine kinase